MGKRVHLHIKYVERSEEMFITQDLMKYAAKRLGITQEDNGDGSDADVKRAEIQIYVTHPEYKRKGV